MLISPIKNRTKILKPRITQYFGENVEIYKQFGELGGHSGIDFGVPVGTPVYAPFDGVATCDTKHPNYGWNIRIKNSRLETICAHLSKFNVQDIQEVKQGEVIGYTGGAKGAVGSGFSTGPHLHWGVRHLKNGQVVNYNNGNWGWEDVSKSTICWYETLCS